MYYGPQGPTVLVLICSAGILAGGTINLAVDLRGCLYFLALTGLPFAAASFVDGTRTGIGLGAVSATYLLVLTIEARHLHRAYWKAVHTHEQLQIANETKTRFLATVSHELRTPLTGILGHIDLLLDGSVRDDQRRSLLGAKHSADALLRVINDLLDVSKVEAGKLELVEEQYEVETLLRECIETVVPRANSKGLKLVREIEADVPRWVVGDSGRVRQVLLNLLGNAIKFTEVGQVTASVSLRSETDDDVCLAFRVRDTGIGIPPERQLAIFEAFTQADATVSRRFGGTGLGLTISAQLVRLMGGSLDVESEAGHGSTFRFSIRCRKTSGEGPLSRLEACDDEAAPHRRVADAVTPLQILLAEDNPHNGHAVSTLLRRRGHHVTLVSDGVHAVAAVQATPDRFDIVLMDINMPGMGGMEATQAIRRLERDGGHRVPIIALTADALPRNRLRCREAGMDAFATKPVEVDALCLLMDRLSAAGVDSLNPS